MFLRTFPYPYFFTGHKRQNSPRKLTCHLFFCIICNLWLQMKSILSHVSIWARVVAVRGKIIPGFDRKLLNLWNDILIVVLANIWEIWNFQIFKNFASFLFFFFEIPLHFTYCFVDYFFLANALTYGLFSFFAMVHLHCIHSEFVHSWDPVLHYFGLVTTYDHHVRNIFLF